MDEEYWGTTKGLASGANTSRDKKTLYEAITTQWSEFPQPTSLSKRLPVL